MILQVDPSGLGMHQFIQNAIDAANPGDVIGLEPGVHEGGFEYTKPNVAIIGSGRDSTKILLPDNKNINVIEILAHGFRLSHVRIDGNKDAQQTGWGIYSDGYHYGKVEDVLIERVKVHGITLENVDDWEVIHALSRDNDGDGFQIFRNCQRVRFQALTAINNRDTGIVIEENSRYCTVTDFVVQASGYSGVNIAGAQHCKVAFGISSSNSRVFDDHNGVTLQRGIGDGSVNGPGTQNCTIEQVTAFDEQNPKRQAYGICELPGCEANTIQNNLTRYNKLGGTRKSGQWTKVFNDTV